MFETVSVGLVETRLFFYLISKCMLKQYVIGVRYRVKKHSASLVIPNSMRNNFFKSTPHTHERFLYSGTKTASSLQWLNFFFVTILSDSPLKYNQNNIMTIKADLVSSFCTGIILFCFYYSGLSNRIIREKSNLRLEPFYQVPDGYLLIFAFSYPSIYLWHCRYILIII